MKRDKALMGDILKTLSSFGTSYADVEKIQSNLETKSTPPELILHHLRLLHDRGLVAVDIHQFWRITDQGYDVLETGNNLSGASQPVENTKARGFDS
ncbi:hypothetical protein [Herbaspirillum sp. RV1423]|uniref:hypothetical protein n=1 Tax=Herbaspirillum sp. RV1423 TaxID=1443993 RepID=UPI0004AF7377|nr:hypothetical protein [Herbaspirillum sp. RV1423]